jgi:hypothetical protein
MSLSLQLGLGLGTRQVVGGFSPTALFAASEQGAWYDPSDLTSMRQLSTGATAVTAPGDSVGFIADKRLMGGQTFDQFVAAQPELVTNGDFSTGAGWTLTTGVTIVGGVLNVVAVTSQTAAFQNIGTAAGNAYQVTMTVTRSAGSVGPLLNGSPNTAGTAVTASGTYTWVIQPTGTVNGNFSVSCAGFTGTIDNISVKAIPGNHATQATAAARPILGREPVGGRRNLLTYTEQFDNAAWTKVLSASVSANSETSPIGDLTADTFVAGAANSALRQTVTLEAIPYTYSVWLKRKTGTGDVQISVTGGAWTTRAVTSDWTRFNITQTPSAGSNFPGIRMVTSGDEVYVWSAQLEVGSTATDYQKVVSQYDVTEAGVSDVYYLAFDGVDDSLATASIDFSATDEMSVFAGVRKLSDAAGGTISSLANVTSINGSFEFRGPRSAAANYMFASRGTALGDANTGTFTAPITNLVTGIGKISTDTALLRVDGIQVASAATDQGSGNYSNNPLFIGRLNGTALPFNGRIYSLIVRGLLTSGDDLTNAETYVAGKTGVNI